MIIGLIAGWAAGKLTKGSGFGLLGNLLVGVIGAFVGGLVFTLLGLTAHNLIGQVVTAIIGAIIALWIAAGPVPLADVPPRRLDKLAMVPFSTARPSGL